MAKPMGHLSMCVTLSLLLIVVVAKASPRPKEVKCMDKRFKYCSKKQLYCPKSCPRSCVVNCASCQHVCKAPPPLPPPLPPPRRWRRSPPPPPRWWRHSPPPPHIPYNKSPPPPPTPTTSPHQLLLLAHRRHLVLFPLHLFHHWILLQSRLHLRKQKVHWYW